MFSLKMSIVKILWWVNCSFWFLKVHFPGVTKCCFQQLLVYLYTDEIDDSVNPSNCLELLELANRLCLPRLVGLVEQKVIHELVKLSDAGVDATEHALRLLEPCQVCSILLLPFVWSGVVDVTVWELIKWELTA